MMNGLPSIKRRLEKIEASRPGRLKPWRLVYAYEHDPCLEVNPPPWDEHENTLMHVFVRPGRKPMTDSERDTSRLGDMQYYGEALRDWEKGAGHGP